MAPSITKPAKMVGVLGLAIWGLVAFVTLRTARNFLLNLQAAKRTGLPYVIGRKLALDMLYAGTRLLCEVGLWCEVAQHGRFGDLEILPHSC